MNGAPASQASLRNCPLQNGLAHWLVPDENALHQQVIYMQFFPKDIVQLPMLILMPFFQALTGRSGKTLHIRILTIQI